MSLGDEPTTHPDWSYRRYLEGRPMEIGKDVNEAVSLATEEAARRRTAEMRSYKEGRKDDESKPRYDLLAPEALAGIVEVLTLGAAKYGDRNWERGLAYHRVFGAIMRHLWAWWGGENLDSESGKSHLDHAATELHFLSTFDKRGMTGFDDRPRVDD